MTEEIPKPRKRQGKPPFVPTHDQRRLVQVMSANGDSQDIIRANIAGGIDRKTLVKYFNAQLTNGREQTAASIGAALVKSALAASVPAMKFWLATRGGERWREARAVHVGGIEGAPPVAISTDAKVTIYLPDNQRPPATVDEDGSEIDLTGGWPARKFGGER